MHNILSVLVYLNRIKGLHTMAHFLFCGWTCALQLGMWFQPIHTHPSAWSHTLQLHKLTACGWCEAEHEVGAAAPRQLPAGSPPALKASFRKTMAMNDLQIQWIIPTVWTDVNWGSRPALGCSSVFSSLQPCCLLGIAGCETTLYSLRDTVTCRETLGST